MLAVAGGLAAAGSGSAQTPGARTLSFFEADAGSRFALVDNPPKSPVRNPESRRFRFSAGGSVVSQEVQGGSQDTLTLLP